MLAVAETPGCVPLDRPVERALGLAISPSSRSSRSSARFRSRFVSASFVAHLAQIAEEIEQAERRLEATQIRFDQVAGAFRNALKLAANCQRMYLEAPPQIRRQANRTFFEKLLIEDGEVVDAELAKPSAQLLDYDQARRLEMDDESADQRSETQTGAFRWRRFE